MSITSKRVTFLHELKPAPYWAAVRLLQWCGFGIAGLCLLFVMTVGGFFGLAVGVAAAFVGSVASALAERLSPYRLLKGIRVKDVATPMFLTVPYYTRLGQLATKHSFNSKSFCAVVRDGSVLGVLSGEDLMSLDLQKHSHDTVEWHMKPLDSVEAVSIADDAAEAIERIKRYRRSFLPVLDGSRFMGIVTKDGIIEEALRRSARAHVVVTTSGDRETLVGSLHRYSDAAELFSAATREKES